MLNFDMFDELSRSGEPIAMPSAILNRAAMRAINFMRSREVLLQIFDTVERSLDGTAMNIASVGLDNVHKVGMPSFDVSVKFVFAQKSDIGTSAAWIRTIKLAFLRMAFQVTVQVIVSRKPFPMLASRDIAPIDFHMTLEMAVEFGRSLECKAGSFRSTARPLACTWSNEVAECLVAMVIQVLSEVLFI